MSQVVWCSADGTPQTATRSVPPPASGELLLRMVGCGLCGTDLFKITHGGLEDGVVLGHELVGEIAAMGDDVPGYSVGDRVVVPHHVACGECALCRRGSHTQCEVFRENLLTPGGFSELVLVRERAVRRAARRLPDAVEDRAAVFMEPAACVLRGLDRADLPNGEGCAVVIGAGSMGLLHLLVLRAAHPGVGVIVSDPVAERRRLALELGADAACQPGDELVRSVAASSGGLGADAVFDTVGGAPVLTEAVALTRPGGSVVLFAHARPGEPAGFEINPLFKFERRVLGTYSGGVDEQRRVFDLIVSGRLDASPLITHTLPLSRFDEAVALALERRALKVLLVPDP